MKHWRENLFCPVVFLLLTCTVCLAGAASTEQGRTMVQLDGLEWMTSTSGEDLKWPDAVSFCETLEHGGRADWRLPTMDELAAQYDPDAEFGIRAPFDIETCCLWSNESLASREAEDGDGIGGQPEMYHWGYMFDGGLEYYAVHLFEDGQALCVRDYQ